MIYLCSPKNKRCRYSSVGQSSWFVISGSWVRIPLSAQDHWIRITKYTQGRYQSGQLGQTVNLLAHAFGGSNPSLPTHTWRGIRRRCPEWTRGFSFWRGRFKECDERAPEFTCVNEDASEKQWRRRCPFKTKKAEVAQLVEHQPSKLRVAGSNLVFRS